MVEDRVICSKQRSKRVLFAGTLPIVTHPFLLRHSFVSADVAFFVKDLGANFDRIHNLLLRRVHLLLLQLALDIRSIQTTILLIIQKWLVKAVNHLAYELAVAQVVSLGHIKNILGHFVSIAQVAQLVDLLVVDDLVVGRCVGQFSEPLPLLLLGLL